jgi:hypothetical protein
MTETEFELFFQVMVEDSLWLDSFDKKSGTKVIESHSNSKSESSECQDAGTWMHSNACPSAPKQPQQISNTSHAVRTYGLLKRASLAETVDTADKDRNIKPRPSKGNDCTLSRGGAISIEQLLN